MIAKLVILGILSSTSSILASYTYFLTTPLSTVSLDFLKSSGTYQHLIYLPYFLNCLKHLVLFVGEATNVHRHKRAVKRTQKNGHKAKERKSIGINRIIIFHNIFLSYRFSII